jgi:uncharacterized membrane protein YbhN (UPF0104 family)
MRQPHLAATPDGPPTRSTVRMGSNRHGWITGRTVGRIVGVGVVAAAVAVAVGTHQSLLRAGLGALAQTRPAWVLAGAVLECVSMVACGLLQRRLLRAGGAALTLTSVLSTVYNADAIAAAVPVAGASMATAFAYRDFRRHGVDVAAAAVALALAGAVSAVTYAAVVAVGAGVSGNPVAGALGVAGGIGDALLIGALVAALRSATTRARLQTALVAVMNHTRRLVHLPAAELAPAVVTVLDRFASLRVGRGMLGYALLCGTANWSADALALAAAIEAAGGAVPWGGLLLVWSAGAAATTLSPTPGGLGAADAVVLAGLLGIGVTPAVAAAAVVLYRIMVLKPGPRLVWFAYSRRYRHAPRGTR